MSQFLSKNQIIAKVKHEQRKPGSGLKRKIEEQARKLDELHDSVKKRNLQLRIKRAQYETLFEFVVSMARRGDEDAKEALRQVAQIPSFYKEFNIYEEIFN